MTAAELFPLRAATNFLPTRAVLFVQLCTNPTTASDPGKATVAVTNSSPWPPCQYSACGRSASVVRPTVTWANADVWPPCVVLSTAPANNTLAESPSASSTAIASATTAPAGKANGCTPKNFPSDTDSSNRVGGCSYKIGAPLTLSGGTPISAVELATDPLTATVPLPVMATPRQVNEVKRVDQTVAPEETPTAVTLQEPLGTVVTTTARWVGANNAREYGPCTMPPNGTAHNASPVLPSRAATNVAPLLQSVSRSSAVAPLARGMLSAPPLKAPATTTLINGVVNEAA